MTTSQFEQLGKSEARQILSWRFEQLLHAGYPRADAQALADSIEVDLHLACRLARSGCPAATALRILL